MLFCLFVCLFAYHSRKKGNVYATTVSVIDGKSGLNVPSVHVSDYLMKRSRWGLTNIVSCLWPKSSDNSPIMSVDSQNHRRCGETGQSRWEMDQGHRWSAQIQTTTHRPLHQVKDAPCSVTIGFQVHCMNDWKAILSRNYMELVEKCAYI